MAVTNRQTIMSVANVLKDRLNTFRDQHPNATLVAFGIDMWRKAWRLFMAKIYLRSCKVGRYVSVNGRPIIGNLGEMEFGDEVRIWSTIIQAKIYTGKNGKLIVGQNTRLNGVHIDAQELIVIGQNVRIAPYTIIMDSDFHDVNNHFSEGISGPIIIQDDVWLATRCTILKGVTIGRGAVVATGAVVTRDVPEYSVVAGVPAKVIRKLR
jgi:acetyltransferase-like isoleucine patch superfamily enzyme